MPTTRSSTGEVSASASLHHHQPKAPTRAASASGKATSTAKPASMRFTTTPFNRATHDPSERG